MSSPLRRLSCIYAAFLISGIALIYLLMMSDSRSISRQYITWCSAIEAAAPRLLVDGNLVKLEALLRTEQDILSVICNPDGQILIKNKSAYGIQGCFDADGTYDRKPLIFDSRQVGWLLIRPSQTLAKYVWKYLLVITTWVLSSFIFFVLLRRRTDIQVIDRLIRFVFKADGNVETLRRYASGNAMLPLVNAVVGYKEAQERLKMVEIETEKNQVIIEISTQVAHDIRSPLAALENVLGNINALPEDERILIRTAVNRIKDIANNLLEKNRAIKNTTETAATNAITDAPDIQLLSSLIDPLITEKRIQFRSKIGIEIDWRLDASSYGLFAKINAVEFKRVLSNLINNSVEALSEKGNVTVSLGENCGRIEICVSGNGKGIAPDVLAKLGGRGETHGKHGGSGLGLYHARNSVESWGGKLELASRIGKGTVATVTLQKAIAPQWFVSELKLFQQTAIVVLDDDASVHGIWQARFDSMHVKEMGIEVLHFSTPDELIKWVTESPAAKTALYLADFELLGHKQTGLDLIDTLKLGAQSILVTSHFEDKNVREGCDRLNVRLIPKGIAGFVPISFEQPLESPDYVLIDDDELVHMAWKSAAKKHSRSGRHFTTHEEFFLSASRITKDTKIYIDSILGHDVRGEEVAKQIAELGFNEIWLCTGLPPENFKTFTYLRGCVSKDAPW